MTESLEGKKVRQFRIEKRLGKGGMGDVYAATDEVLGRTVALKVLRSDMRLDSDAKARFLREARVLSKLEHPNICRIYDLIEEGGNNYLVLELIPGTNLRDYSSKSLSGHTKLKIIREISGVLAAAHGKGVVHRDLKPENIMITPEGSVKLLDFGLAGIVQTGQDTSVAAESSPEPNFPERIISGEDDTVVSENTPQPTEEGSFTRVGTIMGTLSYMSPEQARGEQATTTSDIFSLGLVMQELLTGRAPYPEGIGVARKLALAQKGETLPAEGIDADTAELIGRMKSLAPAGRPTAMDVVEKLEWIAGKPGRRMKRLLLWSAAAILIALAAVMSFQAFRISREAERANKEAVRANREAQSSRRVSDFLVGLFEVSDPNESKGNSVTARELLDKGSEKIAKELKQEPIISAQLMNTMGKAYYNLGLYSKAKPLLKGSAEIRREKLGENDLDYAESLFNLADLVATEGDLGSAEKMYTESLAIKEKNLGPTDPALSKILANLGWVYYARAEYDKAEPICRRAVETAENTERPDPMDLANAVNNLAMVYRARDELDKAEPLYLRTVEIVRKAFGDDHPSVATAMSNLAVLYESRENHQKAEAMYLQALAIQEKIYGQDHIELATTVNNLARLYAARKDFEDADRLFARALAIHKKFYGEGHYETAILMTNIAAARLDEGKYREAEENFRKAIAIFDKSLGRENLSTASCMTSYAACLKRMGRMKEAIKVKAEADAIKKKLSGKG